jgi:hypothetical protein
MNRGNRRDDIFLTDKDRHVFQGRFKSLLIDEDEAGNAQVDDLKDRKTSRKDLRQMAMELCYRYSNCMQKEIGAEPGASESQIKIKSQTQ